MPQLKLVGSITPKDALAAVELRTATPLPTFSWADVWQHEHSAAFTVAKSAGFDVLGDIDKALNDAIKNGMTFDDFQKQLTPILQDKGWWGRAPVLDPQTGEVVEAQLGSLRRLQTIYDTNMRVSYAAGRFVQQQANIADQPWWMYLHGGSLHPRPQHLAWDHTALPAVDPFWATHYPPNGWGCSCTVVALSNRQYDSMGNAGLLKTVRPPLITAPWSNPRTGEIIQVPDGIDPGFGYNVGEAFLAALRQAA